MKIICIGNNYVAHANTPGSTPRSEPVIFTKPDSALLRNNDPFYIPNFSNTVYHGVELIIKINRLGRHIEKKFAHRYYSSVGLGIGFTAQGLLDELKTKGLPWEKAKAFDKSAVISNSFIEKEKLPGVSSIKFRLDKNGKTVQQGNSSLMVFTIDEIIAHVSRYFTLKIGDLIYTGTPSGEGKVHIGDRLEGYLEDKKLLDFDIK